MPWICWRLAACQTEPDLRGALHGCGVIGSQERGLLGLFVARSVRQQLRFRRGAFRSGVDCTAVELGGSDAAAILVFDDDANGSGSLWVRDSDLEMRSHDRVFRKVLAGGLEHRALNARSEDVSAPVQACCGNDQEITFLPVFSGKEIKIS